MPLLQETKLFHEIFMRQLKMVALIDSKLHTMFATMMFVVYDGDLHESTFFFGNFIRDSHCFNINAHTFRCSNSFGYCFHSFSREFLQLCKIVNNRRKKMQTWWFTQWRTNNILNVIFFTCVNIVCMFLILMAIAFTHKITEKSIEFQYSPTIYRAWACMNRKTRSIATDSKTKWHGNGGANMWSRREEEKKTETTTTFWNGYIQYVERLTTDLIIKIFVELFSI